jgi:hypothetical protein
VYAERDLQCARDPGALDFSADADSVIEEDEEEGRNLAPNSSELVLKPACLEAIHGVSCSPLSW